METQIQELPSGNLCCARNGNHVKWYYHDGNINHYLPKKERSLAEQLAVKKYLSALLDDYLQENQALQAYLNHHTNQSKAETLLNRPYYHDLLAPHFTPLSEDLMDWLQSPYEQNPHHPEHLLHKSSSGHLVRSKSEAIIDTFLYIHKIPFRYECALQLGEITLFPDFTIRHPRTGKFYYWEHFGLMDHPPYAQNAFSKLQLYTSYNLVPSIQLITTYETKEHPLSTDTVEKIIAYYFQ